MRWKEMLASEGEGAFRSRASASGLLFNLAARLYSYPSREWLVQFLKPACLLELRELLVDAYIGDAVIDGAIDRLEHAIDTLDASLLAYEFRIAYTALHQKPPIRVSLECSWWMRRHGASDRVGMVGAGGMNPNDRALVQREYQSLGLRIRQDVGMPADHVANELDYMAYVLGMEGAALDSSDHQSALEWDALAERFATQHLVGPAERIAQASLDACDDVLITFAAHLLRVLAKPYDFG